MKRIEEVWLALSWLDFAVAARDGRIVAQNARAEAPATNHRLSVVAAEPNGKVMWELLLQCVRVVALSWAKSSTQ